jgi:hypothetical protein
MGGSKHFLHPRHPERWQEERRNTIISMSDKWRRVTAGWGRRNTDQHPNLTFTGCLRLQHLARSTGHSNSESRLP